MGVYKLRPSSDEKPYANCAMLHPDGHLICYTDEGRKRYYTSRGLAKLVQDDPPVIQLLFKPKGPGHVGDPFFMTPRDNRCVVCGVEENLTRHHVVPQMYRSYFPQNNHARLWGYDVLLTCTICHQHYEEIAEVLKNGLTRLNGLPIDGTPKFTLEEVKAIKATTWILRDRDKRIPATVREAMLETIRKYTGEQEVTLEVMQQVLTMRATKKHPKQVGQIIVERLPDPDSFAIFWRRHFCEVMKPKFLSPYWNTERRIYTEIDHASERAYAESEASRLLEPGR